VDWSNPADVAAGMLSALWTVDTTEDAGLYAAAPESGGPVNTPLAAYVDDVATVTPLGRDGWSGPAEMWVEFVTLTRPSTSPGWLVSGLETAP